MAKLPLFLGSGIDEQDILKGQGLNVVQAWDPHRHPEQTIIGIPMVGLANSEAGVYPAYLRHMGGWLTSASPLYFGSFDVVGNSSTLERDCVSALDAHRVLVKSRDLVRRSEQITSHDLPTGIISVNYVKWLLARFPHMYDSLLQRTIEDLQKPDPLASLRVVGDQEIASCRDCEPGLRALEAMFTAEMIIGSLVKKDSIVIIYGPALPLEDAFGQLIEFGYEHSIEPLRLFELGEGQ